MSEENKTAPAKKPFFKSVSFKCIVVLLIIALVSGIFLTFCNALFAVSDTERLERALGKLYDNATVTYDTEADTTPDSSISVEDATISDVYKITSISGESTDSEYVLNVTGTGGFSGGSVTCYIRVYVGSESCEVKKISISSNSGQSYIAKVGSDDLEALVNQQDNSGFTKFSTDGISCGATYSLTAISNATNAARTYMNAKYLGITTADPYEKFLYTDYINKSSTTYDVNDAVVTYSIVTKGYDYAGAFTIEITVDSTEKVTSYSITKNGSTTDSSTDYATKMYTGSYVGLGTNDLLELIDVTNKTVVDGASLDTGATYSNYLCAYAALFATANYQNCIGG